MSLMLAVSVVPEAQANEPTAMLKAFDACLLNAAQKPTSLFVERQTDDPDVVKFTVTYQCTGPVAKELLVHLESLGKASELDPSLHYVRTGGFGVWCSNLGCDITIPINQAFFRGMLGAATTK